MKISNDNDNKITPTSPYLSNFISQASRTTLSGGMPDTGDEEDDFAKHGQNTTRKGYRVGRSAGQNLGMKLRDSRDKSRITGLESKFGKSSQEVQKARMAMKRKAKMRMVQQRARIALNPSSIHMFNPRNWFRLSLRGVGRMLRRLGQASLTNPYVLMVLGFLVMAVVAIIVVLAIISMIIGFATIIAATSFLADDDDLNNTTIAYTEGEVEIKEYLLSMDVSGFNEAASFLNGSEQARLASQWTLEDGAVTIGETFGGDAIRILVTPLIQAINHCPHMLLSGFTAILHDQIFYPQIRPAIFAMIDMQYQITTETFYEIRTQTVIMTFGEYQDHGWYEYDGDGGEHWISYMVWVEWEETVIIEYEWHFIYIFLDTTSMEDIFREMFATNPDTEEGADQEEHFDMFLEMGHGNRQFVGSPFDFRWDGFVSSRFGWRLDPFTGTRQMHRGIDIARPTGTPVIASQDGTVTRAEYQAGGFGNWIEITHYIPARLFPPRLPYMIHTRYAHLHEISVYVGQEVEMGDPIGTVGSTGASTGPHLHFEVIRANVLGNRTHFNPFIFAWIGYDDEGED
ncbi:MAG: M23 family metallopeptidase [Defluviitaleaceae bacterium]|nr:M23 family metallopeptidase [Defluviitaleaceae bacterium]